MNASSVLKPLFLTLSASLTVLAHAETVTFQLTDVQFEDGGIASGSFSWNLDTSSLISWDIITTAGSLQTQGAHYSNTLQGSSQLPVGDSAIFVCANQCATSQLYLAAILPFGAGSALPLHPESSEFNSFSPATQRTIAAGYLMASPVPEVQTGTLLFAGLLAVHALVARRRQSNVLRTER